jgi:hypothetical protein
MARHFAVKMPNTYASVANAIKAVEKTSFMDLRYVIAVDGTGRFFPLFIGSDELLQRGVHFKFAVMN